MVHAREQLTNLSLIQIHMRQNIAENSTCMYFRLDGTDGFKLV